MNWKRIGAWFGTLVIIALFLIFAVPWYAQHRVKTLIEPYISNPEDVEVFVDLIAGDLLVNSAELLVAPIPGKRIRKVTGHLDSLIITGVSVYRLLFKRAVDVDEVRIWTSELNIVVDQADTLAGNEVPERKKKERTFSIGSFNIRAASLSCEVYAADTSNISLDSLVVKGSKFTLNAPGADRYPHLRNSSIGLSGFRMEASSGYALEVGSMRIDENAAIVQVQEIVFGPTMDLQKFATTLDYERDAFEMKFGSISILGFDLERMYATKAIHASALRVTDADVIVMRDKTLRDGPQPYRPLLGKAIRKLPLGSGVDSLVLSNLSATYHERADRDRGFGVIPFTALNAICTGVRNSSETNVPMVLDAQCVVFDDTPVTMHLTTDLQDTTDRFVVDASMGLMYFPVINKASAPLADVRATAGVLQSLVFHMEADDRRANGTVKMRYDGIKLTGGRIEKDRAISGLLSVVINAVVRNDSKGAKGKGRIGTFEMERRRNRAIFNYLWTGLKEGSMGMLLPKPLTK